MKNVLGKRIKQLREEKALSQLEFAKLLNISNSTLSQYEAGNRVPSDDIKKKIADLSGTTVDYLLGNSDIRNPYNEDKELDEGDVFLLDLKKKADERGIKFDLDSAEDLLDLYEFIKKREEK